MKGSGTKSQQHAILAEADASGNLAVTFYAAAFWPIRAMYR